MTPKVRRDLILVLTTLVVFYLFGVLTGWAIGHVSISIG